MATYTIKDLEKLSGIKAHTIRMWEKRYGLLEPGRTGTNIRYYSDDDMNLRIGTVKSRIFFGRKKLMEQIAA